MGPAAISWLPRLLGPQPSKVFTDLQLLDLSNNDIGHMGVLDLVLFLDMGGMFKLR